MTLKQKLLELLSNLPNTQEFKERKALISCCGLDTLSYLIDYSGSNFVFFNNLIDTLVEREKDSFLEFIQKLSNSDYVGVDTKNKLQSLYDDIIKIDSQSWHKRFYENSTTPLELKIDKYLKRDDLELSCYNTITIPGTFLRIKAPRFMGKTSLMRGIIQLAKEKNYLGIRLPFTFVEPEQLQSLELFLKWLCRSIIVQLNQEFDELGTDTKLSENLDKDWDNSIGQKLSCKLFFERNILRKIDCPLVLGFDDIDKIYEHKQIIHDFSGLLREWNEEARGKEVWKKLRLIVTYSKQLPVHPTIFESPINVGTPIILKDLTKDEIYDLTKRDALQWTMSQVDQLMNMIGGYPFLVGVALQHISSQRISLDEFLRNAVANDGVYGEHLQSILTYLQKNPKLLELIRRILELKERGLISYLSDEICELESMGLIIEEKNRRRKIRCELYKIYFENNL